MKKTLWTLVLAAWLLAVPAGADMLQHVSDLAGILSAEEASRLEQQAQEVYDRTGFDVILHTTNDSQGKGPMDYSFDYYHAFRDAGRYPDGALFAILFDTRDYYEAARGRGIALLTHRESNDLANVVQGKLSGGDYYGAMRDYVQYVGELALNEQTEVKTGTLTESDFPTAPRQPAAIRLIPTVALGLITAGLLLIIIQGGL